MSETSIAHVIQNILEQCDRTVISIGPVEGHFLSTKQFAVLEECVDDLLKLGQELDTPSSSAVTQPSSEEGAVRARRLQLTHEVKRKQLALVSLPAEAKTGVNDEIGKLLSERAKLDKLIKKFDAVSLD
jgi:hypothetical protein